MYKSYPETVFIGQKIIYLPSCHSTNDVAADYLGEEGVVIITDDQTAGRGQRGNRWETHPGENLTVSVVLRPSFLRAEDQFRLSIAVSLAVADFLSGYLPEGISVKWPNDLYFGDRKLGGILIENTLSGAYMASAVVGIGLNINQLAGLPPTASSVRTVTGKEYLLEPMLHNLCMHLEGRYLQLRNGGDAGQKRSYLNRLFRYQEWHPFRDESGHVFNGMIAGIADNGRLAIQKEDNSVTYYGIKEVSFVIV